MWNKPWLLELEESSYHQVKKVILHLRKEFHLHESGLFKNLCCFLFFWTILCKMAWSYTHKTDFWSFSFELFSFEKLLFFLLENFLSWSCMVSSFQGMFDEMISSFYEQSQFSHSTLSTNLLSCNCLWVYYELFQFLKEIFSSCRAFLEQWAYAGKFLPRRLIARLFFGGSSCEEFHLPMDSGGNWGKYAWYWHHPCHW